MVSPEAAVSIVHHHEHLLGVATGAHDEEVVLIEVVSLLASSLLAALRAATGLGELIMTALEYVRVDPMLRVCLN
jgi:hypothetical protein